MGKTPQAPVVQAVQPDPALDAIRAQATQDAQNAQTTRTQQRTTDLLLRYGARQAFAGTGLSAPLRVGM